MVSFQSKTLYIGESKIDLNYEIEQILENLDMIFVLFKINADDAKESNFRNLWAFDKKGNQLWIAENPDIMPGDNYYKVLIVKNQLKALSWGSYECDLDINTGKILHKEFTK